LPFEHKGWFDTFNHGSIRRGYQGVSRLLPPNYFLDPDSRPHPEHTHPGVGGYGKGGERRGSRAWPLEDARADVDGTGTGTGMGWQLLTRCSLPRGLLRMPLARPDRMA
jgi:hypothetical protein